MAPRERTLGDDGVAPAGRGHGARERAGGPDQLVLGRQRVDLGIDLRRVVLGAQPARADVGACPLHVQRFGLDGARRQVDAENLSSPGHDVCSFFYSSWRLAIKLPGTHPGASTAAALALAAGIDQLTVVLPDTGERWACLSALRQQVGAGPDLVAVGGIRCRADVDRARACGASGVQVHRLFTAQGAQCLQGLIQPTCSDGDADS